jgi:CPA2 family monovalent cation:H+ antiporter-2
MIDYSSRQIDALRTFGIRLFFGDATRPDLLQAAGIAEARVLIVALDDAEQITALVKYVRHAYPNVHVMARAINRHHVYELWAAGCRDIVRETYDSSLRMGRSTLEALGLDRATAQEMVDAFDEVDRAAMIEVAPVYRPGVPVLENPEYVEKIREIIGPRQEALKTRMISIRSAAERKTGS